MKRRHTRRCGKTPSSGDTGDAAGRCISFCLFVKFPTLCVIACVCLTSVKLHHRLHLCASKRCVDSHAPHEREGGPRPPRRKLLFVVVATLDSVAQLSTFWLIHLTKLQSEAFSPPPPVYFKKLVQELPMKLLLARQKDQQKD